MIQTKNIVVGLLIVLVLLSCSKEFPVQPRANQPPKTFMWLFPDSTIAPGISRQRIRWWGEDPDGFVVGYLFAIVKLSPPVVGIPQPDTISWTWTNRNDSLIAFPLLTLRDTFTVFVRAIDNTVGAVPTAGAQIRFLPRPYWDKNADGMLDPGDQELTALNTAIDVKGTNQWMPLRNQPPSIRFAYDPNDPTRQFQQPETTYTAATFAWAGSDPDGDQTIIGYRIALNDTTNPSRIVTLSRTDTLVTLFVPRSRSNGVTGEVTADLLAGTFLNRRLIGTIPGLKLDSANVFYVQSLDVAGDSSHYIRMPAPGRTWFVRKPQSRLLVISDYVDPVDSAQARLLYRQSFASVAGGVFANYDELNIGRGLDAVKKKNFNVGAFVPPFIDPGMVHTLRLFDVVFWYTDMYPSLGVAQRTLYYYSNLLNGKVVFTTGFEISSDPRGALTDFSPIDSVSSVDLNVDLKPRFGDKQIFGGTKLIPDSSVAGNIYPVVAFDSSAFSHFLFLRPVYRRANARYIYSLDEYRGSNPVSYSYVITTNELRAVNATPSGNLCVVGLNGSIVSSTDGGTDWTLQTSGTDRVLRSVHFPSNNNGWAVGDAGTILRNSGGNTWTNQSVVTSQELHSVRFFDDNVGYSVGTRGLAIKTTNGGTGWTALSSGTTRALRGVSVLDANTIVVVGDSALIRKSTDGGSNWNTKSLASANIRRFLSVNFPTPLVGFAVGVGGIYARTTDAGETWTVQTLQGAGGLELRSVAFADASTGYITATGPAGDPWGWVFRTVDGGITWTGVLGPSPNNLTTQSINGVAVLNTSSVVVVGSGGVILKTTDGGIGWSFQPKGKLNVGVVDGSRRFVFLGVPLHLLRSQAGIAGFLNHVFVNEFGF